MKHKLVILALLSIALPSTFAAPSLKVGDPAPPLKVAKWIKGQPVEKFGSNSVYVVEFWATWCAPCKKNIPHLTELAKKFEGKATIIGVSIWESEKDHEKRLAKVGEFVSQMGTKMEYSVAADNNDGFMGDNWMKAAEEGGIPTAFIVGKDGKIAWIGYPWQDMDQRLAETIAGTLNTKAVQSEAAARQADKDARARVSGLLKPVSELQQAGKPQEALAALDKVVGENPDLASKTQPLRFDLLLAAENADAFKLGRKLLENDWKDEPSPLYTMSRKLSENPERKIQDYALAVDAAKRAAELRKNSDVDTLYALANAYYRKGDLAKAVETGELAVQRAEATEGYDAHSLKYIKRCLEQYKAAQQKASQKPAAK